MRALTVAPGRAGPVEVTEVAEPDASAGALLVVGLALGVCGTDKEIVRGEYGLAPPGQERLVLGHESLGRVHEAPDRCGFSPGDLVVGVVRRPDPVPCGACAQGYRLAADALAKADLSWLDRLITRRVPLSRAAEAFTANSDDVKVVITLDE